MIPVAGVHAIMTPIPRRDRGSLRTEGGADVKDLDLGGVFTPTLLFLMFVMVVIAAGGLALAAAISPK